MDQYFSADLDEDRVPGPAAICRTRRRGRRKPGAEGECATCWPLQAQSLRSCSRAPGAWFAGTELTPPLAAVVLGALYGGLPAGALALGLGFAGVGAFLLPAPVDSIAAWRPLALFLVLGTGAVALVASLRDSLRTAERRAVRAKAEATAAREAGNFLDSVVDSIPAVVFLKDGRSLRYVRVNQAGEQLLGRSRNDVLGKTDYELFPAEIARTFRRGDDEALARRALVDVPEEPLDTPLLGRRVLHTKKIPVPGADGSTRWLLGISEDVTARKQLEQEREMILAREHAALADAEAAARRLRELLSIAETALGSLDPETLLSRVVSRVHAVLAVDTVSVLLLEDGNLRLRAAVGLDDALAQGLSFPADRGLAGRTLAARGAVVVDDIAHENLASPVLREHGVRAVLAVPMRTAGRAVGVLHVGTRMPRRFTRDEATFLQLVADRVALATDRAALFER